MKLSLEILSLLVLASGFYLFIKNNPPKQWTTSRWAIGGMYLLVFTYIVLFAFNINPNFHFFIPFYMLFLYYTLINEKKDNDSVKSQDTYKMLMDNTEELICQFKLNGDVIDANESALNISGYSFEQFKKLSFKDLINPADHKKVVRQIRNLVKNGTRGSFIIRMIDSDGNEHNLSVKVIPIFTGNRLTAIQSIARNITNELRVLKQAQFLASVIKENQAPIFIFNEDGKITEWNRGMEILSEINKIHAINQQYNELFPDIPDLMLEAVAYKGIYRIETTIPKGSSRIPVSLAVYKVKISGEVNAFAVFLQDLSQQKLLEEKLSQNQRMEALGRLAGGVAHDFNNILTIMSGNALILKKSDVVPEKMRPYLEAILNSASRGANLTSQLLTFSRDSHFTPKYTNLPELIRETVNLISHAGWDNIDIDISMEPNLPDIWSDSGRIQQVLMNLCVNAKDAMSDGGKITIRCERCFEDIEAYITDKSISGHNHYVKLSIRDNGSGMSKALQEKIFEPFYTTKEDKKGTGLGLANVHGIVKQHRGWIDVESEEGIGSEFKIYLPISKTEKTALSSVIIQEYVDNKNISEPIFKTSYSTDITDSSEQKHISPQLMGNETVLIVDDNTLIDFTAKSTLELYGYNVLVTISDETVSIVKDPNVRLDLIIINKSVSQPDCKRILEKIKLNNINIPVVVQCGKKEEELKESLSENGVDCFLNVPYIPDVLIAEVREILDKYKKRNNTKQA